MNANNSANDKGEAFGSTTSSAPIERGYSFLKQAGEIKKHATNEEMCGRAKDKRTYLRGLRNARLTKSG